ncbi:hypothetical protein Hypma_011128 [Hypsizygus marmoreus]|uniref:Cytochrome P450 n=1 Tax=Hypsizygus marmoreus TaxID=39966 RepID=A0A369JKH5_HYPMA|nr:hypothetical protein Hypma_011128 [Hypsizygus marmoreus]
MIYCYADDLTRLAKYSAFTYGHILHGSQDVIPNPEDVHVFYHDAKDHSKAHNIGFGVYIGRILGHCVGVKHNEDWRRLCYHIDGHFLASVTLKSFPIIISDVAEWLDAISATISEPKVLEEHTKFKVDAREVVSSVLLLKVIARTLFSELLNEKLMSRCFFGKVEQWALTSCLPMEANHEITKFLDEWSRLMHHCALEAESKGIRMTVSELYGRMQEGHMTFLEFSQSVDEILFNNIAIVSDIVSNAISWTIILVAKYADAQARLMREIRAAFANSFAGSRSEKLEAYLRRTDTFLHYCCLEAGHLQPTSFFTLPEVTATSKVLGGYTVSAVWGNDGDIFHPERFQDLQPMHYRYSFLHFDFGSRKCVGQHFSDKIVKAIVLQVIEWYSITIQDEVVTASGHFLNTPARTLLLQCRVDE